MLAKTIEKLETELKQEGMEKGKEELIREHVYKRELSAEQISIYTDIPLERVKEIIKNVKH